jgi:hypothetical protein
MSRYNQVSTSGEGTRPTTSGGVDNIGAGEKLGSKRNAAGEEVGGGPAPAERMGAKRHDVENNSRNDLDVFGMREDLSSEPSTEPKPAPEEMPANQPKGSPRDPK